MPLVSCRLAGNCKMKIEKCKMQIATDHGQRTCWLLATRYCLLCS
jgi:hypothetical protein